MSELKFAIAGLLALLVAALAGLGASALLARQRRGFRTPSPRARRLGALAAFVAAGAVAYPALDRLLAGRAARAFARDLLGVEIALGPALHACASASDDFTGDGSYLVAYRIDTSAAARAAEGGSLERLPRADGRPGWSTWTWRAAPPAPEDRHVVDFALQGAAMACSAGDDRPPGSPPLGPEAAGAVEALRTALARTTTRYAAHYQQHGPEHVLDVALFVLDPEAGLLFVVDCYT